MKTIHKFGPLKQGENKVLMRQGAQILTAQIKDVDLYLWALVDTDAKQQERVFDIVGTGQDLGEFENRTYITTVQDYGFVWHIFEKGGIEG